MKNSHTITKHSSNTDKLRIILRTTIQEEVQKSHNVFTKNKSSCSLWPTSRACWWERKQILIWSRAALWSFHCATDFCVGSSTTYLYRALYSLRMFSKEGWEVWWHQELSDSYWFDKQSGRVRRDNDVVGMHHNVPAWTSVLWLMFGQKHPLPFLNSKSRNQHVKWVSFLQHICSEITSMHGGWGQPNFLK